MRTRTRQSSTRSYPGWMRIISPLALALIVAIGGAMFAAYKTGRTSSQPSSAIRKVDAKKEALPSSLGDILPVTEIQQVATATRGSQTVDVALENRSGVLVYVVTLQDGTVLSFDALSGKAVELPGGEIDDASRPQESLPAELTILTSFEDALELAQSAFPGSTISRIQLRTEKGSVVMSVRFEDQSRIDIDPSNGAVIRVTTSTGATAESTSPATLSPSSEKDPSGSAKPPDDPEDTGTPDNDSENGRPDTVRKNNGKTPIRIEGPLTLANGIYTVTDDNVTYTIQTDKNISDLVDEAVRIDGKLEDGSVIRDANVHTLR